MAFRTPHHQYQTTYPFLLLCQVNFPILGQGGVRCCDQLIVISGGGNLGNVFNDPLAGLRCPGSIQGIPLPITLKSFKGVEDEDGITLNWTTSLEDGNDYFILERSIGLNNFEEIGSLHSKGVNGNSHEDLSYSFTDEDPIPGTTYYRLRQVDQDGTASYVGLLALEAKQKGFSPHIFPNPTSGKTYLYLSSEDVDNIEIVLDTFMIPVFESERYSENILETI